MKFRDTLVDFAVFIFFSVVAAVVLLSIDIDTHWVLISLITAITGTGIFRMLLPYSSLPRDERKRRDMLCNKINQGVFTHDPKKKRYLKRTIRLYHNGQFRRALIRLDRLRSFGIAETDRFALCFWTGMCCYYMKLYTDAIDELSECLRLKEDSTVAANLGLVYLKLCDYQNSEGNFRSSLRIDPTNVHAMHGLSLALLHQECYAEALEICHRGIELDRNYYQFLEVISLCYAAIGDIERSYQFQRRLMERDSYDGKKLLKTLDELFKEDGK